MIIIIIIINVQQSEDWFDAALHSSLLSANLFLFTYFVSLTSLIICPMQHIRGLPLPLFPSTCPSTIVFIMPHDVADQNVSSSFWSFQETSLFFHSSKDFLIAHSVDPKTHTRCQQESLWIQFFLCIMKTSFTSFCGVFARINVFLSLSLTPY